MLSDIIEVVKTDLSGKGFMQNIAAKVSDNIQINIENLHVQIEVINKDKKKFIFGVKLHSLETYTVNEKWEKAILDRSTPANKSLPLRKVINLTDASFYFHTSEKTNIDLIDIKISNSCYVLHPTNLTVQFTKNPVINKETPSFSVKLITTKICFQFSKEQYNTLLEFGGDLATECEKQVELYQKRRYLIYRPLRNIKEKPKEWWKYAIKCVCKINRGEKADVNLYKEKFYQKHFSQVFIKEYMKTGEVIELHKKLYNKSLVAFSLNTLYNWTYRCLYQIEKDKQQQESKNKPGGFLGGLMSWGALKKEVKEEKKETIEDKVERILKVTLKEINEIQSEDYLPELFIVETKCGLLRIKLLAEQNLDIILKGLYNTAKKHNNSIDVNTQMSGVELVGVRKPDKDITLIMSSDNTECLDIHLSFANTTQKAVTFHITIKHVSFFYQQILVHELCKFFVGDEDSVVNEVPLMKYFDMVKDYLFDLVISLESINFIVPVLKNGDSASPAWILRAEKITMDQIKGNLSQSMEQNIHLSKINLEYCYSYYNYLNGYESTFRVFDNFSTSIPVFLQMNLETSANIPLITIKKDIKDMMLNFTPIAYERLIFIKECFPLDAPLFYLLKQDKESIMRNCTKEGKVHCWINSENTWSTYYAVLSEAYMYFYRNKTQKEYAGYYCVDKTVVIKHNKVNEIGLYQLLIENWIEELKIGFERSEESQSWYNAILSTTKSLSKNENNKKKTPRNAEKMLISCNLSFTNLLFHLYNNLEQLWSSINFTGVTLTLALRCEDIQIKGTVLKTNIEYSTPFGSEVVTIDNTGNSLELILLLLTHSSPLYKGVEIQFKICVGEMKFIFIPPFIKHLMQYVTTSGKLGYEELNLFTTPFKLSDYLPDLDDSIIVEPTSIQRDNCKANSTSLIDLTFEVKGATVLCLHHKYNTPFIKGVFAPCSIRYQRLVDHELLTGRFERIEAYDMTGYPLSTSPLEFKKKPMDYDMIEGQYTFDKLVSAVGHKEHDTFQLYIYANKCPLKPKEKEVSYVLNIRFASIWGLYIHELILRRVKDYLLEQVIYSLSPAEDWVILKPLKSENLIDFQVPSEITHVHCIIDKLDSELRPKSDYGPGLKVFAVNVTMDCTKTFENRRYLTEEHKNTKAVYCDIISITGKHCYVSYLEKNICNPFEFNAKISSPRVTSDEYNLHDPKLINLEYIADVELHNSFSTELAPIQINYILQCLSLNFNYTDGLDSLFHFSQDKPCTSLDENKFEVNVNCPGFRMKLSDTEGVELVETQTQDALIKASFHWNGINTMDIKADGVIMYDFDMEKNKVPMVYSKDKKECLNILLETGTKKENEKKLGYYKCNVNMKNQMVIFRINTIYLLMHNLYVSLPDYEIIPFKFNNCNSLYITILDYNLPSITQFELSLKNSSVITTGKEGTHALALDGEFVVKYNVKGLTDAMTKALFYMDTGEKQPYRELRMNLKEVAAFICMWSSKPKGYYTLNNCQCRLLLEPVKNLEYWQKYYAVFNDTRTTCTYIISQGANADNIVTTISYLEAVYLLNILEHHLEHLSRIYYPTMKNYYLKVVPKLTTNSTFIPFTYDNSYEVPVTSILEQLLKACYFYIGENVKLEEIRQEYLHFNRGRIEEVRKQEDVKYLETPRYHKSTIRCTKYVYEFWANNEINMVYINQFYRIFSPLFFIKITSPSLKYCYFGLNDTTNNITGGFSVSYYNESASAWEPFIEPFTLQYTSSKKVGDEIINLEVLGQTNINITEEYLAMMKEYSSRPEYMNKDKENEKSIMVLGNTPISERPSSKLTYETASTYAIDNQSGETLSISILDFPNPQKISVFPNERVNLCTRPSDEVKSYFLSGRRIFRIKIEFPTKLRAEPIHSVNLSSVGSFDHKCGRHFFQCTNKIKNTQKVLTITTSFQVQNELDVPIVVRFYKAKGVKKEYVVSGNSTMLSIPLSLIDVPTSISLKGSEELANTQFTFIKLSETLTNPKNMLQLLIGKNYYVILSLNKDNNTTVTKICVWAPFCIRNYLPVPLEVRSIGQGDNHYLKPMETLILHNYPMNYEDTLEIHVQKFKKSVLEYDLGINSYSFKMVDNEMNEVTLHMEIVLNTKARYLLLFYAEYVIKDFTQDNLIFLSTTKTNSEMTRLAGQGIGEEKVTLLDKPKTLTFFLDSEENAADLRIRKTDTQREFEILHKQNSQTARSEYILLIKQEVILSNTEFKTSFCELHHKYIFLNETKRTINIYQSQCKSPPFVIKPNTSLPFYWVNIENPLTVFLELEGVRLTENFAIDELGCIAQQLISIREKKPCEIIRIERYIDKGVRYIKIMNESKEHPCYIIQNESKYVTVEYKERNYDLYQYIPPNSKVALGWVYPQKTHIVSLRFLVGRDGQRPIMLSSKSYYFSMDKIARYAPVDLLLEPGYKKLLWVALESDEDSKILRIRDMVNKYNPEENKINHRVRVFINSIGVSIIVTYIGRKKEILFTRFNNIEFSIDKGDIFKDMRLTVKDLQIDNQMWDDPLFPIILSRNQKKLDQNFLNVHVKSNLLIEAKPNFYSFDSFEIDVVPFIVKLEENTVIALSEFSSKLLEANPTSSKIHSEIGVNIENFKISKIKFIVTYRSSMEGDTSTNVVAKSLAAAFIHLKEMPFKLNTISYPNMYGKLHTLLLMVLQNYQAAFESKKLGIVTRMMFSPFIDVNQIGVGLTNFISHSIDSNKGIVSGTGSLVKGAVAGTFGTVSGVTSAFSQGILALSTDEEYIKERQKDDERYRPQNVIEGIGFGLFSTLKSVGSGLAGVVTKPIEGVSKEGVKGLLKGMGQGLAGVVVKPISGGLDLISKTMEGIKNTANMFDDKLKEPTRMRHIRPFYTSQRLIKNYDEEQAIGIGYVMSLEDGKYKGDYFLDLYAENLNEQENSDKEAKVLFISEERIVSILGDISIWEMPMSQLDRIEKDKDTLIFKSKDVNVQHKFKLKDEETAETLHQRLTLTIV